MEWKRTAEQSWAAIGRIVDVFGRIGFIVGLVGGAVAMIWAWFQEATAPFIIPAGAITFAAVLFVAKELRGNRASQPDSVNKIVDKDDRLGELISGAEKVKSDSDFDDWIETISEYVYFRIGPEEIGQPFQDTLKCLHAGIKGVGLERSIRRTVEFLKTIR